MKTKGLEKTKATETMWSWQAEQAAKTHLRRHKHVIKHTPACVDHYPPGTTAQLVVLLLPLKYSQDKN